MKAWVTGGYFDDSGEGVLWQVDFRRERAEVALRWAPELHLRVPGKGFAGGSVGPDRQLFVATHAAVVRVDLDRLRVTGVLHQPCMNDLHHVAQIDNRMFIANTGLGAIDVFDPDGTFLGSHALLPAWANSRRIQGQNPPAGDPPIKPGWAGSSVDPWPEVRTDDPYLTADRRTVPFHNQKVRDFLHVNHVTRFGDRLLATCFADGTLRDLTTFKVATDVGQRFIHDGIGHRDTLWLTAIDGTLIELASDLRECRRLDAFTSGHYGWCRGLAVSDDHLAVGLTEVRAGRLPRHPWADRHPHGSETSILLLDRQDGTVLARVDLTDRARHSKVYSILPEGAHE